ncbi:MAG: hypothetical protein QOD97_4803, partial [Mycobacterium sp.]|nr:hypothetical protein [Mycobacterium sp.]
MAVKYFTSRLFGVNWLFRAVECALPFSLARGAEVDGVAA